MSCGRESAGSGIASSTHSMADELWSSCTLSRRISGWSKMTLPLPGDD